MRFLIVLFYLLSTLPAQALNEVDKAQAKVTNILPNPGIQNGKAGFTLTGTGASLADDTSIGGSLFGNSYLEWNSDGAGQVLSMCGPLRKIHESNNAAGAWKIAVPSGAATHVIKATDGTNDISNSSTITNSTKPIYTTVNGTFPESGNACLVLTSVAADEPAIRIYYGRLDLAWNIGNVSQATFVGGMENAGASSCIYGENSSSGLSNFVALGTGSSCAAWTVTSNGPGTISAQGTNDHRLVYTNMPPGVYRFELAGRIYKSNSAGLCIYALSDGTNTYQPQTIGEDSGVTFSVNSLTYSVNVTTPGNRTFSLVAADNHGSITCGWRNEANTPASWKIYRYPSSNEQVYSADVLNWKLDLNISGSSNINLGTSDQSSYITPSNSDLSLTVNTSKGSASAGISCSSTNDNTVGATTCSSGNEEPGFVANLPRAGLIEVCYEFAHISVVSNPGDVAAAFQIVRTANGSQTIAEEGGARVNSRNGASSGTIHFPHRRCGTFNVTATKHTFRLMYEQVTSGTVSANTIAADASSTTGQRDIKITARYIDQQFPAPVLVNSITTKAPSAWGLESFQASNAGVISNESGDWVNGDGAVTSTSRYTYTLNAGVFSAKPTCTVSADDLGSANLNDCAYDVGSSSSTSIVIECHRCLSDGSACTDIVLAHSVICHGPR